VSAGSTPPCLPAGPPSHRERRRAYPSTLRSIPGGLVRARQGGQPENMSETTPEQNRDYDPEADPDTDRPKMGEQVEADEDRDQAEGE
jgi:hypothetical protein